jgi:hypothetical protein
MSSLVPAALAVLVMLPRLCSPEFGLLDDGLTLRTGREVVGRWWSVVHLIPETGRFFPAYWMAYAAIVGVVGARPRAFFAVNVLLLATLLVLLVRVVRWGGGTQRQAWLAAAFLAASGPAIETFYTLSKAEPLQMIWIGVSLLATSASASQASGPRRAALILLAATALLLAYATKETTLVLIPVSLGWLVLERWSGDHAATSGRFAKAFVAINIVAAAAFAGLRWCYAPLGLAEGTYTRAYSLDSATVAGALFHIGAWLVRDFAFLAPVLAVVALVLVGIGVAENINASWRLVGYALLWMVGWLAVYVPWPVTFQYYLLPFALGAAVVSGVIIGDVASGRRYGRRRPASAAAWSLLVTTGFLWSLSIVNAVADARVQIAVDRVNADLVRFLARAPRGSHVFVNTAYVNEHVFELPLHLSELNGRPDIIVEHVSRFAPESLPPALVFVVTPQTVNQPAPTVRVGVDESGAARAGAVLTALLNGRGELVYRAAERTPVLEVATHRLLCRLWIAPPRDATYCPADRGVISWRTFVYGWQVHRVRPVTDPAGAEAS